VIYSVEEVEDFRTCFIHLIRVQNLLHDYIDGELRSVIREGTCLLFVLVNIISRHAIEKEKIKDLEQTTLLQVKNFISCLELNEKCFEVCRHC
jgi:hypothetical protein